MNIKPVKTKAGHRAALKEIESLMNARANIRQISATLARKRLLLMLPASGLVLKKPDFPFLCLT